MDWLRRNWPDLLIGLALVAVIAGIVATLLTGGSFFPLGESGTTASLEQPAPSDTERPERSDAVVSGGAADEEQQGADGAQEDGPGVAVLPPSDERGPADVPETADPDEAGGPQAAPTDERTAQADGVPGEGEAGERASAQPLPVEEEPETSVAAAPADEPESAPPEAASAADPGAGDPNAGLPSDPFRVSVGAFTSGANAEQQAQRFRDEGYPVFIGAQGDLSIVLVGPYQQRSEAERVASDIGAQHADVDPVIYRYEAEGAPADEATVETAAPAGDEGEPVDEAPTPASGGVQLQVGAYATPDSAAPQIERLQDLGFQVEQQRDGGLIRLLVGPFQGGALEDARTLLEGAGIDHFAR